MKFAINLTNNRAKLSKTAKSKTKKSAKPLLKFIKI